MVKGEIPPKWDYCYAALEKGPGCCTDEEKKAVGFFLRAAVFPRATKARKNFPLWSVFPRKQWHLMFALAATLLSKFSDPANVVANSDRDSSSSSDSGRRVRRRKCVTSNRMMEEAATEYMGFCGLFKTLRKADGSKNLFDSWDIEIGNVRQVREYRDVAMRPCIQPAVMGGQGAGPVMFDEDLLGCSSDEEESVVDIYGV